MQKTFRNNFERFFYNTNAPTSPATNPNAKTLNAVIPKLFQLKTGFNKAKETMLTAGNVISKAPAGPPVKPKAINA